MPPIIPRAALLSLCAFAACAPAPRKSPLPEASPRAPGETAQLDLMIAQTAKTYGVPVSLVHRVVRRESSYNPAARNGPYIGLMQILPQTARTMGYRGPDRGLFDAATNLKYGVKYLRGAWLLSHGNQSTAVMWYSRGYYYEARRRGMLQVTGLEH